MPRISLDDYLDQDGGTPENRREKFKRTRSSHAILDEKAQIVGLDELGAGEAFSPSLGSSRHEREWIFTYLGPFYENQTIIDVLKRVKGGKEANVYVCKAHPSMGVDLLAAKVYRPRLFRNLRNDSRYRANRQILDERGKVVHKADDLHAMAKGTSFGQELRQTSWLQYEYTTIEILHSAGLPVPSPIASGENTILMEYFGDLNISAPALNEVSLPRQQVRKTFDTIITAIEGMLVHGRIHADLSAYNILYWQEKPVIIDFPQAVDPRQNPESWAIFYRDVERVCQYFSGYGLRYSAMELARTIWDRQNRNFVPEIPEDLNDREFTVE
jgi:RIO kinase 1